MNSPCETSGCPQRQAEQKSPPAAPRRGKKGRQFTRAQSVRISACLAVFGSLISLICGFLPLFRLSAGTDTVTLDVVCLLFGSENSFFGKVGASVPGGALSGLVSVLFGILAALSIAVWIVMFALALRKGISAFEGGEETFSAAKYLIPGMCAHLVLAACLNAAYRIEMGFSCSVGAGGILALTCGALLLAAEAVLQLCRTDRKTRAELCVPISLVLVRTVIGGIVLAALTKGVFAADGSYIPPIYACTAVAMRGTATAQFFGWLIVISQFLLFCAAAWFFGSAFAGLFPEERESVLGRIAVFPLATIVFASVAAWNAVLLLILKSVDAASVNMLASFPVSVWLILALPLCVLAVGTEFFFRSERETEDSETEKSDNSADPEEEEEEPGAVPSGMSGEPQEDAVEQEASEEKRGGDER